MQANLNAFNTSANWLRSLELPQGSRIAMTREGRPFVRLAAAALDARRQAASLARHSIAV